MSRPYLSVVIPAYNESANLQAGALEKVANYLAGQAYTSEVIVVDDGSQDETRSLVEAFAQRRPGVRLLSMPHRGKARTVAAGLSAAQGEIVLFSDMDQATPIREIARLLPWFEQGCDVVIGSRGTVRRHAPLWRQVMSRSQVLLRRLLLGFENITDTQCGFKAFRGAVIPSILSRLYLYGEREDSRVRGASVTAGFDVELLFVAQKLGYRIREVPVEWDYQRTRRVNLLKDARRGVSELIRIRRANQQGKYD